MRRIVLWVLSTLSALVAPLRLPHVHLVGDGHGPRTTRSPARQGQATTRSATGSASGSASGSGSSGSGGASPRPRRPPSRATVARHAATARCRSGSPSTASTITDVTVLQYPDQDGHSVQINAVRPAAADQRDPRRAGRAASPWSAAPPTPARATCSRCRAPSTRRGCDRRRRAGGRPPRRARDGHADQPRAAGAAHRATPRPSGVAGGAGRAAVGGRGVQHLACRQPGLPAGPGRAHARAVRPGGRRGDRAWARTRARPPTGRSTCG